MEDGIDPRDDVVKTRVHPLLEVVEPSVMRVEAPRDGVELTIEPAPAGERPAATTVAGDVDRSGPKSANGAGAGSARDL
ncbi:MAG TPA: hypothetical protein VMR21_03810 [Vicinamibacteria bacterium]|nr:hypothetical protein [Vicinamibacteria bacterium]